MKHSYDKIQEDLQQSVYDDCKILYPRKIPWYTSKGWNNIIHDFSYKCEELNLRYYNKYRLRIHIDEIKQKWGELRIYANIVMDPNRFFTFIRNILLNTTDKISQMDFAYKTVVDIPKHKIHLIEIFDDEKTMNKSSFNNCSNVKTFKWFDNNVKITYLDDFGKTHLKPTKKIWLYMIRKLLLKFSSILIYHTESYKQSAEINVIREYMQMQLDSYIGQAEKEASQHCEICGTECIDNKCETIGYVRILCEKCAKDTNTEYICGNKIYKHGEFVRNVNETNK